jgi:hypothetical protein
MRAHAEFDAILTSCVFGSRPTTRIYAQESSADGTGAHR